MDDAPHTEQPRPVDETTLFGLKSDRIELISTIVLAVAVILTAWSAFQAGKWSGVQAINFSEAGAARTESTRFDARAGQSVQVDVAVFVEWLAALNEEINQGLPVFDEATGEYTPTPGTLSYFLHVRMRDEFRPAFDAWLASDPVNNPDAALSPFDREEYELADQVEADRLKGLADEKAATARAANQFGDTYVLTAVMFATVLFFGGVASKLKQRSNRRIALVVAFVVLIIGLLTLASLPVELGDELFFLHT